jgi:hypothetical protein
MTTIPTQVADITPTNDNRHDELRLASSALHQLFLTFGRRDLFKDGLGSGTRHSDHLWLSHIQYVRSWAYQLNMPACPNTCMYGVYHEIGLLLSCLSTTL